MASLQKPRKLSIRGSDGKVYGVLAKPKDDMRKDQRLMELLRLSRELLGQLDDVHRQIHAHLMEIDEIPGDFIAGLAGWEDSSFPEKNSTISLEMRTEHQSWPHMAQKSVSTSKSSS